MNDIDIIDSHPGNVALAGRPSSFKNSLVGNFRYANSPEPMYADAAATTPPPPTPIPAAGPDDLNATVLDPVAGPSSLDASLAPPAAGPTGLNAVAATTFRITIIDTEANILSRQGDPMGTIAFGSDTKDLYVFNTLGFDKWTHYEDN